ncbi:sulfite exporter TauE/SafE family protein [Adlercreutzia murintestinalis]|uniref:sulfite exporter TauE/SafE family protein n=1 Tax=Adlercreutzia murintestinalis TaxID=2941325 RepID=UPI002040CC5D|nr:sulfite exporter TauE/SafE family protein [Adlercreutzia murintestinalis]
MPGVVPLIAALAVGLGIGVLSGMLGIGGGTIMIPVFKLGFGMTPVVCTATSLFAIILTAISGSIGHIRGKTCVPKLGLAIGLGGAVTSPVGVWLANLSPDWAIMAAAICVILYSAVTMFQKALKVTNAPSDVSHETPWTMQRKSLLTGAAIGMAAGVASGYVGIGGGFLIVPMMLQLLEMPMRLTSGTSLIAVMILAIPGVIAQAMFGNVDWLIGLFMALGTMPGAFVGARLMSRVPERTLRLLFAGFLVVAAVALLVDQLGIL